jgi:hypothetical protein
MAGLSENEYLVVAAFIDSEFGTGSGLSLRFAAGSGSETCLERRTKREPGEELRNGHIQGI